MLIEVDLNPYNLNDFTEYLNADYTNPSSCIQHQTTEQKIYTTNMVDSQKHIILITQLLIRYGGIRMILQNWVRH